MNFLEALRAADIAELPDNRFNFVSLTTSKWGGEKPPCCAIGGANLMGGKAFIEVDSRDSKLTIESYTSFSRVADAWPCLGQPTNIQFCWICRGKPLSSVKSMDRLVIHLYDFHEFSRTEIADLLEEKFPEIDWN